MGAFASSFEKAFIPAAKSSSDATLELLKEKIKKDAESAQEKLKVASQRQANATAAEMFFGPENAKKIIGVLPEINSIEGQKTIGESLKTMFDVQQKNLELEERIRQTELQRNQLLETSMFNEGYQPASQRDIGKAIVESGMLANKSGKPSTGLTTVGGKAFVPIQGMQQGIGAFVIDNEGNAVPVLNPQGGTSFGKGTKMFKQSLTPEEIKEREISKKETALQYNPQIASAEAQAKGEKEIQVKGLESAINVASGIRSWGVSMEQFEKAFPSDNKLPLEQRIGAVIEGNLTKAGLKDNAQMVAAQKSLTMGARRALKAWGDKGALSDKDVKSAEKTLDQSGLTLKEKMQVFKSTAETALSSLADEDIEYLFKKQPYMKSMIDGLGIRYGEELRRSIEKTSKTSSNLNINNIFEGL